MEELKPLLDLLGGTEGRIVQVVVTVGALRIPLKLISGKVQAAMEKAIQRVVVTADQDDDILVEKVLKSLPYRVAAFVIDWAFSVKLPLKLKPDEK